MRRARFLPALAACLLAGCGGGDQALDTSYPVETRPLTPEGEVIPPQASLTLRLPAGADARFAGYLAAQAKGFFEDVKLDVELVPDGAETGQAVASGDAELEVATLPDMLAAREAGTDLVNIAQVFRRGGDGVVASGEWLAEPDNRDVAVRFLQGAFLGWAFCREYADECLEVVLAQDPALDAAEQRRLLNEVNSRIWPNPTGIGTLDPAGFRRAVDAALRSGAIERPATQDAWRDDLALLAVTEGEDEDQLDTERHWDLKGQYWRPEAG